MSIFGNIMSKIFSHGAAAPTSTSTSDASSAAASAASAGSPSATSETPASGSSASADAAQAPVDVEAVLTSLASKNAQTLDWRKSIVDLMKLLNLDSSLTARKELAAELHYTGDTGDSATMNIWLHKQVMQKLAENGGKVPADLQH